MSVLRWDKMPKAMSTRDWVMISADGAPPGVYVPNMSTEDAATWRAELPGTRKPPIRVTMKIQRYGVNTKVIVDEHDHVSISSNGTFNLTFDDWIEFMSALTEIKMVIHKKVLDRIAEEAGGEYWSQYYPESESGNEYNS